jgi:D-cysteine desulfhydrase
VLGVDCGAVRDPAAAVADGGIVPGRPTVFLHTGGLPGLFGHPTTLARAEGELTERA